VSKKALGKGIDALLGGVPAADSSSVTEVPLVDLRPNPEQPRHEFNEAALRELADSIRHKGVLQPVLAEADDRGGYLIVAGERRVRAARLAGLETIPALVRDFTAQEKLEIALIENVQREDLSPIEEAQAYKRLMEMGGLSQEQIALKVGKDRSTVANTIRLLKLPEVARSALDTGAISQGHARALLMLENVADQQVLLHRIIDKAISVREAEELASRFNKGAGKSARAEGRGPSSVSRRDGPDIRDLEQRLIERFGTKVEVRGSASKGKIQISYFSEDDLERILQILK
jgi:ParB family chromosome partitioning protein